MTDQQKRGRKPAAEPMPDAKPPVVKRRKNIIGSAMPYMAPKDMPVMPSTLGYRPKKKPSRPMVQPNPV